MSYTAHTIRKHLMIFGGATVVFCLIAGIGSGDDFILAFGLIGLGLGAIYGCGLIIAALVVAIASMSTTYSEPGDVDPSVVDEPKTPRKVDHKEMGRALLLSGILILLIGGSLCLGSLSLGPAINIH